MPDSLVETVTVYLVRRRDELEVLLLRRPAERGSPWVAAGGLVEPGETSRQAAVREVCEETGWDVGAGLFDSGLSYRFARDGYEFVERVFFALAPAEVPRLDPREHVGYRWKPLEAAAAAIEWEENRRALLEGMSVFEQSFAGTLS